MGYIAMNRFQISLGREADFEDIWKNRKSRLGELPGFVEFRMLKGVPTEDHTPYVSHTVWSSRDDFDHWTQSEQFKDAHKNAGKRDPSIFKSRPVFEGFDTVLRQSS